MSLHNAISFLKQAAHDSELRKKCNKYPDRKELLGALGFNDEEFEDAVNMQLVKCQTYEEAEVYQQLKMWFNLL